jgi:hypothetical protein
MSRHARPTQHQPTGNNEEDRCHKHVELLRQASEYLAAHPELYEIALRAWQMGMDRERVNAAVFDDDRRVWRKPRAVLNATCALALDARKIAQHGTIPIRLNIFALDHFKRP